MTEPSSPDLSFSELLDVLSDNNAGAITPQDVRSIAALSRPSFASTGTGVVGKADLQDVFTSFNHVLPDYTTVHYIPLHELTAISGATTRSYFSGHLEVNLGGGSTPTRLGPVYTNPDGQPRTFQYEWDLTLRSVSDQTFWAITFYYLPEGTTWPGDSSGWTNLKVHHSEALFASEAKVVNTEEIWQSSSTGSKTLVLNPGDTVVPILEYWGRATGTSEVTDTSWSNSVVNWSFDVISTGVAPANWNDGSTYFDVENSRARAVYDVQNNVASGGTTGSLHRIIPIVVRAGDSDRPASSEPGTLLYDSRAGHNELLVWTNSNRGWTKPWNMPWGDPGATAIRPTSGSYTNQGFPQGGVTGGWTNSGSGVTFNSVAGRKYRIQMYGTAWCPDAEQRMVFQGILNVPTGNVTSTGSNAFVINGAVPGTGLGISSGFNLVSQYDFSATGYGSGQVEVKSSECTIFGAFEGSNLIPNGATTVSFNGDLAQGFSKEWVWNCEASLTRNWYIWLENAWGSDPKYLFDDGGGRLSGFIIEDIGPATAP